MVQWLLLEVCTLHTSNTISHDSFATGRDSFLSGAAPIRGVVFRLKICKALLVVVLDTRIHGKDLRQLFSNKVRGNYLLASALITSRLFHRLQLVSLHMI